MCWVLGDVFRVLFLLVCMCYISSLCAVVVCWVIVCLTFVACCLSIIGRCLLLVVRCSLFVARPLLFVLVLFVVC